MKKYKSFFVKLLFIILILIIWQILSKNNLFGENTKLIFPSIGDILNALIKNFTIGYAGSSQSIYIINSIVILLKGSVIGIILAFLFSGISLISDIFNDIFNLVVSICDLLPGVALLPIVIVIYGIKTEVIMFLVIHSVLWPMARNVLDGFRAVPKIYVESGYNFGLNNVSIIFGVYIPASISYIISGLKVSWARAWRGLISAEMIFSIASIPGIGLYINQMRANMKSAEMYATLMIIVVIGLIVQYGILVPLENITVRKWGMSK